MYLNAKTYFSYRYGVMSAEDLVQEALKYGVQSLALTNINCTADHWDFLKFCNQSGIKPLLGVEIRNDDELLYLIIAKDLTGLQYINRYISDHLQQKIPFPEKCPVKENVWLIYPLQKKSFCEDSHEWIGIKTDEVNKIFSQKEIVQRSVIRQPVTVKNKRTHNLHRLLRAIDKNIVLSKQSVGEIASADEVFVNA